MRFYCLLPASLCLLPLRGWGQAPSPNDTTAARALPAATVVGYGQRLPLRRTAAGVGVIDQTIIQRFNENSLASAVNTLPGVRLEERATASYRISVRGSTLRSPFGVRNVKLYYFDIPFTEANGTSPLNILDAAQLGRIEVLKGPAGSVYGAGTGGVVRLENRRPVAGQNRAQVGYSVGSFGLRRFTATAETSSGNGGLLAGAICAPAAGRLPAAERAAARCICGGWAGGGGARSRRWRYTRFILTFTTSCRAG